MKEETRNEGGTLVEDSYATGLERVAKVVESAVLDYDLVIGTQRLGKPQYAEIIAEHASGRVNAAALIMARMIRTSRLSIHRIPESARILSFGKTHNNRVQLDYFERKTRPWRNGDIVELSVCEADRASKVGHRFNEALESRLCAFLLGRKTLRRSLIHQLVGYSVTYCSMLESLPETRLRGLVVANDHSPTPVAVSMAAKVAGLVRVYLQHAQVTASFPPLDFEYSILMNRRSERIYEKIGNTQGCAKGHVVVWPSDGNPTDVGQVLERTAELAQRRQVMVGLYPSAIFDAGHLAVLVAGLKTNSGVSHVFLKPHPSLDMGTVAESLGVVLRTQAPAEAHVAIVGNSSVSQELATAGNLVFQDFDLDPIARDYYGFVEAGLTTELRIGDVGTSFWRGRGSCELLKTALSEHFNDAAQGLGGTDETHFFKKVSIDIGGGLDPEAKPVEQLGTHLKLFPRTFFASCRSGESSTFDDMQLISCLDSLFNERTLDLNILYRLVDPARCGSVLDFWVITKLVQWSGTAITDQELTSCRTFIARYDANSKVKRWMEAKYFDLLLQMDRKELLAEFLSSAEYFRVSTAHLNKKIAFLNTCNDSAAIDYNLAKHYDYGNDTLGDLERLKVEVQCMIRGGDGLLFDDYHTVETRFLESAPPSVAREYADVVLRVYDKIQGRDRFIDVKRNQEQGNALVALAAQRLRDRRGFSAVRLSDGEGYLFRETSSFFTDSDARNRERHWWGEELDDGLRQLVIAQGVETVAGADVIGIPSIYRFLRDCSPKTTSLLASIQGRGLASVLHGVLHHASDAAVFGDDKFNIAVFNKRKHLEEIASNAERVIVVTGARAEVVKESLSYLGDIDVINVPTHNKTSSNDRFFVADKPLPYVFMDIREQLEAKAMPGTLVLVGAGIAGKSFVNAAKKAGGVGLDLGSALDQLVDAGIHSLH